MKQRTFYLKKGEPVQKVIETIQKETLYRIRKNRCLLFMKDSRAWGIFNSIFLRCAIHFPVCA